MKFLKTLTTFSLIFALFTLHIEGRAIAFSTSYSEVNPEIEMNPDGSGCIDRGQGGRPVQCPDQEGEFVEVTPTPNATDGEGNSSSNTLDYRNSRQEPGSLTMNQIMVLLILLTGPTVALSCFGQISGKIFSAGAAIYLIMEIMNYSSYKKAVQSTEEMYAELTEDTSVVSEQINAFMTAESMENTAADALKKRAGNTKILAMAVTAASIAAFAEAIWGTATYITCMVPKPVPGEPCTCEEFDKTIQTCRGSPCASVKMCGPAASLSTVCVASNNVKKPYDYIYGPQLYASTANDSDISLVTKFMKDTNLNRYDPESMNKNPEQFNKFILELINNFVSSAHAADSPAAKGGILGGFGITGAALGAVLAWYATRQLTFMNKLGNGYIRGALFAVLAGFAWAAVGELNSAEEKLRSNAGIYKSLYERLLAAMNSSSRFANMDGINSGIRDRISGFQGVRDEMNNPPNGALCLVGNLGEQRVDENCSCRQNNTCSTVDFSAVDFGGQGLPGFFGQTTSGLQTGANSAFSGNLAGANGAFAGLGNNAANLRKLNDRIKGKAAAQLDALNKGKNKTDFKKLEESFSQQLQKIAPSIIKSASSKNGSTLAALGIGTSGLSSGFGGKPEDLKPKDVLASINQAAAPAPSSGGAADPLAGFKFDFPKDGASDNLDATGADGALSQGDALGEFENNESDINDRKSESIFKIITFRYFKSAYPRFFDEDKKEEEKPTLE